MLEPTLIRGDMRYWLLKPDARLREWVNCYFFVEPGAAERLQPNYQHEALELLLPDGYSEIIFCFEGRYERRPVGKCAQPAVMGSSYLIGGRSHSVLTRNLAKVRLAGVKLDPRALHALIATPLSSFGDATLQLDELNDGGLLELEDQLACSSSIAQTRHLLDRFFLRTLANLSGSRAAADELLRDIHAQRGDLSIMEWIRTHELDSRTVERKFSAAMGMTPKRYARIVRFKHSYRQLMGSEAQRTASTWLDGFYDQSHFIREFKFFTGNAPGARAAGRMSSATSISDHLLAGEAR
jgi:AraC-like DNA-binding protein